MTETTILMWTLLAIILSTVVGVLLSRRKNDICLKDFRGYMVTGQFKTGKRVWGRFAVDPTGVEFRYRENYWDEDHIESSFIVYKEEFGNLFVLFRFHDELTEANQARRLRQLQRTYKPPVHRRILRTIRNIFNMVKDAVGEAIGATIAQTKAINPTMQAVAYQQKYVTKAQSDMVNHWSNTYDPILERHIGQKSVLEILNTQGVIEEHVGVLREYTGQFIEVMNIDYLDGDKGVRKCDIIAPRAHSILRHSSEPVAGTAGVGGRAENRKPSAEETPAGKA